MPSVPSSAEPEHSPFIEGVRMGYGAKLAVVGHNALLGTERLLLGVHEDRVVLEPELLEGLHPGNSRFPRAMGSMPEAGWLLETSYAERTSRTVLSRWSGSRWQHADGLLRGGNVIALSTWSAGRTLALVTDEYAARLGFVQLGGPRGVPLPELKRVASNSFGCVHGIQPGAMTALPSGEVFLAGTQCQANEAEGVELGASVVERWGAGQARSRVSVLPGLDKADHASGELTALVASSGSDAVVAGMLTPSVPQGQTATTSAYLAQFDGKSWHRIAAPPVERIDELQRSPNGKIWLLADGALWSTRGAATADATWEPIELPSFTRDAGERIVSSLWVRGDDDVWVTVGSDEVTYLLRTQRGSTPLTAPADERIAELSKALDPNAAYDCETPTLMLLTIGREAPQDADFPSVRRALRGHTELAGRAQLVELPFLTRRYLAVRGEMDALRDTESALSGAHIPGLQPELRCVETAPTRTLQLDFGTAKRAASL